MELVDMRDLGSRASGVGVRVPMPAPKQNNPNRIFPVGDAVRIIYIAFVAWKHALQGRARLVKGDFPHIFALAGVFSVGCVQQQIKQSILIHGIGIKIDPTGLLWGQRGVGGDLHGGNKGAEGHTPSGGKQSPLLSTAVPTGNSL